jgi:hypothetical protein
MSAFVEGAFSLGLPLSKCYVFPKPLNLPFYLSSYHICKPPFIRFQSIASLLGIGANAERVELKFGLDFESPLLFFISFFRIMLSLFFLCLAAAINLCAFNPSSHERMDHDPLPKFSTLRQAPGWKVLSMVGKQMLPL